MHIRTQQVFLDPAATKIGHHVIEHFSQIAPSCRGGMCDVVICCLHPLTHKANWRYLALRSKTHIRLKLEVCRRLSFSRKLRRSADVGYRSKHFTKQLQNMAGFRFPLPRFYPRPNSVLPGDIFEHLHWSEMFRNKRDEKRLVDPPNATRLCEDPQGAFDRIRSNIGGQISTSNHW